MTRIRSTVPRTAGAPPAVATGTAQLPSMGPLTLRSINAVEVQGIVIHRSTYFGLTDAHDVYPQMSNAEHRALVEWERRRADMIADLPDSVDE